MVNSNAGQLEQHSIEPVPESERHGKVRDQFTFWFAANATALNFFFGSLAIILGLSFGWTIVAILIGTIFGTTIAAIHAQQGPRLGVPQLVQSRGQFGYYGAVIFFAALIVLEFGFMASQMVIQAFALNQVWPSVSVPWWIIIVSIPVLILVVYGHDLMHTFQKLATVLFIVTAIIVAIQVLTYDSSHAAKAPAFKLSVFLEVTAIFVINAAAWAPNISDYSRYLPSKTPFWRGFWAIFVGMAVSIIVFGIIGARIGVLLPTKSLYAAVQSISGSWALVVMGISLTGTNAINAYTGGLSLLSGLSSFMKVSFRAPFRIATALVVLAAGVIAAIAGYTSFLDTFVEFLDVLAFVFLPWSAINILDFYVIHKGKYDVPSFYTPNGRYGKFLPIPIICYLLGVGVELLFMDQSYYQGPLLSAVNDNDISWILGFFVPFIVYYLLSGITKRTMRNTLRAEERIPDAGAIAEHGFGAATGASA